MSLGVDLPGGPGKVPARWTGHGQWRWNYLNGVTANAPYLNSVSHVWDLVTHELQELFELWEDVGEDLDDDEEWYREEELEWEENAHPPQQWVASFWDLPRAPRTTWFELFEFAVSVFLCLAAVGFIASQFSPPAPGRRSKASKGKRRRREAASAGAAEEAAPAPAPAAPRRRVAEDDEYDVPPSDRFEGKSKDRTHLDESEKEREKEKEKEEKARQAAAAEGPTPGLDGLEEKQPKKKPAAEEEETGFTRPPPTAPLPKELTDRIHRLMGDLEDRQFADVERDALLLLDELKQYLLLHSISDHPRVDPVSYYPNHAREQVTVERALSQALLFQQKWEAAVQALKGLIRASQRMGVPAKGLVRSHLELSSCFIALERYDEAAETLAVAMANLDRVPDEKLRLPLYVDALTNKAELASKRGKLDEALHAAERALAVTEKVRGSSSHPDVWRGSIHLARLLLDAGRVQEADKRFDDVAALVVHVAAEQGERMPLVLTVGSLHRIACIYFDRQILVRAEHFLRKAVHLFQQRTKDPKRTVSSREYEIQQMLLFDKVSVFREQAVALRAVQKVEEAAAKEHEADKLEVEVRATIESKRLLAPLASSRCLLSAEAFLLQPQLSYTLTVALKRIPPLTAERKYHTLLGAVLEAIFENPDEPSSPLVVSHALSEADLATGRLIIEPSGTFPRMRPHQTARAVVRVFADASKAQILGVHYQLFAPSATGRQLRRPVSE